MSRFFSFFVSKTGFFNQGFPKQEREGNCPGTGVRTSPVGRWSGQVSGSPSGKGERLETGISQWNGGTSCWEMPPSGNSPLKLPRSPSRYWNQRRCHAVLRKTAGGVTPPTGTSRCSGTVSLNVPSTGTLTKRQGSRTTTNCPRSGKPNGKRSRNGRKSENPTGTLPNWPVIWNPSRGNHPKWPKDRKPNGEPS